MNKNMKDIYTLDNKKNIQVAANSLWDMGCVFDKINGYEKTGDKYRILANDLYAVINHMVRGDKDKECIQCKKK